MLIVPGYPLLDKDKLVGGCVRLDIATDAAQLQAEVAALPERFWGTRGGRIDVHRPAQAVFLRGHAPAEGNLPIEDREALAFLPTIRTLIRERVPAPPLRCLLALLPGGVVIAPHADHAPYFGQTIRVHVPIVTHPQVWMYCAGRSYHMAAGEVWVLNNSTVHAVWNADPERARTHLICDFLPTPALIDLLVRGERGLGIDNRAVHDHLFAALAP